MGETPPKQSMDTGINGTINGTINGDQRLAVRNVAKHFAAYNLESNFAGRTTTKEIAASVGQYRLQYAILLCVFIQTVYKNERDCHKRRTVLRNRYLKPSTIVVRVESGGSITDIVILGGVATLNHALYCNTDTR